MALTTEVWTGRGFSPKSGILSLDAKQMRFEMDGKIIFDAPVAELRITWPWYGFGCQIWAHAPSGDWFISFLHTHNSIGSWWTGVRKGRTWKRAIENARA